MPAGSIDPNQGIGGRISSRPLKPRKMRPIIPPIVLWIVAMVLLFEGTAFLIARYPHGVNF